MVRIFRVLRHDPEVDLEGIAIGAYVLHLIYDWRVVRCIIETATDKHEYKGEEHAETTSSIIIVKHQTAHITDSAANNGEKH